MFQSLGVAVVIDVQLLGKPATRVCASGSRRVGYELESLQRMRIPMHLNTIPKTLERHLDPQRLNAASGVRKCDLS